MDYDFMPAGRKKEMRPNCVVGIGASAGGLEALQQLLTFLPGNTGMAFVIIQHLAPNHKSMLADILDKYTVMPVTEAEEGMVLERNHIYMIPPKYNLEVEDGVLHLKEYDHTKINHPVDIFFRSLANAYDNRAIAVILSGTGSDGTNGIRTIKERNGVIIVQTPESAKFDGMPRNAISTGFVDLIQNPDSIAREMSHIASSFDKTEAGLQATDQDMMSQIFSILKSVTNINYTYYKQTTILRRIERRLVVTHNRNLREYVTYLTNNPDEAKLLAKEVLIGVTSFFRDQEYFEVLKEKVIRPLVLRTPRSLPIRVWVAGCSTGEEAYSIAILFTEIMESLNIRREVKIFATDLDMDAIGVAGRGIYGDNIIDDVNVTRLSRYFTRKGNKYIIRSDIRKMIIFAQHNVFQDPPFGKLDLISCRNMLIYFQAVLQRNLFAIFHMALKDKGYLFLGRSESVIDYDDVFRSISPNEKIFIHNASGKLPANHTLNYSIHTMDHTTETLPVPRYQEEEIQYNTNDIDTSVLEALMPATILINEKNEVWRTYGDCDKLLSIPAGVMSTDIFSLIRTDLKIAVSTLLRDSRRLQSRMVYDAVPIKVDDKIEELTVVAQPVYDKHKTLTEFTAISFLRDKTPVEGNVRDYEVNSAAAERITNLERELNVSQDNLNHTVTELESVNAELQAANEELLTANEELQSSNEELQSVNEELYTVNSEYQSKVTELAGLNDDLANFLSTTLVGILMVDQNLNIRKFTEYIATEFNVADQDVGRSLRYLAFNFVTIDLIDLCHQVLDTMEPIEKHCASVTGCTYLIRIAPYRIQETDNAPQDAGQKADSESKVAGLVLTFVDTTKQIDDQQQIDEMAQALRQAVKSSKEKETFLSHMSHDMRTPMTAILGLLRLSLDDENLTATLRDNLEKIQASGNYLMNLIDEVLETSRINAGKVISLSRTVKEKDFLDEIRTIIEGQAQEAQLHFHYKIQGCDNRYVVMDTEHVERILMNLLSNALKYTPQNGEISLNVFVSYKGDSQVQHIYKIKDTGIGISKAFQERMFQPFEQDLSQEEEQRGTGLGLYICKSFVNLLHGDIQCESEPGKGTTFTVTLDYSLATAEQIQLAQNHVTSYEDQLLYGKSVLVAEDDPIIAEVIIRMIETKGLHGDLANDGSEAVDFYRRGGSYHYQAVLMDIRLPQMNGFDAAREIRKSGLEDAGSIPIIAVTADLREEAEERCFEAGMNACLGKPIDQDELFSVLVHELERAKEHGGAISAADEPGEAAPKSPSVRQEK